MPQEPRYAPVQLGGFESLGLKGCVAVRKPLHTQAHKQEETQVVSGGERLDIRTVGEDIVFQRVNF